MVASEYSDGSSGSPLPNRAIPPERTIDKMRRDVPFFGDAPIEVEECETARGKLAERARKDFTFDWP